MKAVDYHNELKQLLDQAGPSATWPGETDESVQVVFLPAWTSVIRLTETKREAEPLTRLRLQQAADANPSLKPIVERVLANEYVTAIKLPTRSRVNGKGRPPVEFNLYILSNFGWFWWVGLKMRIIET